MNRTVGVSLFLAFILIGRSPSHAAQAEQQGLKAAIDGPGASRMVTERLVSRVTEELPPGNENLQSGYAKIYSEKVVTGGVTTKGVRVVLFGVAISENTREAKDILVFYLSESEAKQCAKGAHEAARFRSTIRRTTKEDQQYLQWVSADGLVVIAGVSDGKVGYHLATSRQHGPTLGLTSVLMDAFAAGIETAINAD